jgi:hypothetical protein
MRSKYVVSLVVLVALCVGLVMTYGVTFAGKNRTATLMSVKGQVTVRAAGATEPRPATEKMVVEEGDALRTGSGSSVIVRFDDGSMVKIGPLSTTSLGRLSAVGSQSQTQMNVGIGKTWARVKRLNSDSRFTIKTPTAVAGVRGTYYSSEVEKDTTSNFDVFEGSVAVSSAQNPKTPVLVGANQTTTVEQGKAPSKPAAIPKEQLEKDRAGFTASEYTGASFDIQVSVEPATIAPGGKGTLTVHVIRGGAPFQQEVPLHIKLSGTGVFSSNGSSEIDTTTGANGVATLQVSVTGSESETVSVDVRVKLRVKKNK